MLSITCALGDADEDIYLPTYLVGQHDILSG